MIIDCYLENTEHQNLYISKLNITCADAPYDVNGDNDKLTHRSKTK